MKINELIERVKSVFPEKDSNQAGKLYSNRRIYNKLVSSRNRIITQQYNNHDYVGHWSYQTLKISLELVNNPFDNSSFSKQILRSVNKIPSILTSNEGYIIHYCGNVNGTSKFFNTSWNTMNYIPSSKYLKDKIHFLIFNNYLYILNTDTLTNVLITAIFSNPIDAMTSTNYLEEEFPIDSSNIDSLITLTLEELIPNLSDGKRNN